MIEQLVARVFQARNVAHREHLKTKSYAQHMALGDFYDEIIDAIDEIVEVYQGRYGIITIPEIQDKMVGGIAEYIMSEAIWIENNRNKFATCQAVLNRIDDLTALYLRTNYKLTQLR
jgi:hypothetical protein